MHPIILIIQDAAPDARGDDDRSGSRGPHMANDNGCARNRHPPPIGRARSASPVVLLSPRLVLKQWRISASPRNPDAITGLSLTVAPAPVRASCQRLD
jgi:hypothetical protein